MLRTTPRLRRWLWLLTAYAVTGGAIQYLIALATVPLYRNMLPGSAWMALGGEEWLMFEDGCGFLLFGRRQELRSTVASQFVCGDDLERYFKFTAERKINTDLHQFNHAFSWTKAADLLRPGENGDDSRDSWPGILVEDARGWPFRATRCEYHLLYAEPDDLFPTIVDVRGGPSFSWMGGESWFNIPPTLPLRPAWPGFIWNLLFWAVIVAMAHQACATSLRASDSSSPH